MATHSAFSILHSAFSIQHSALSGSTLQPVLDFVDEQLDDPGSYRVEWFGDGEAGGVLVATAAETACDGANVDVVFRSHADADVAVGADLEKDDRLNLARGERQINQPLGVVVGAAAG